MGEKATWFTKFIVRDERTLRGRIVELAFPLGLEMDARSFAELSRAFDGASVRWTLRKSAAAQ